MTEKPRPPANLETLVFNAAPKPAQMKEFGGSTHDTFNSMLANDVVRSMWLQPGWSTDDLERRKTSALVAILAFRPQDEIEAMLAAQAVAMHAASMECSRRAMLENQPLDAAQGFRKAAVTASRAFIELTAALDRKRGKGGKQTVRVEHVHVHSGGQAVVGHISTQAGQGEGGGTAEGKPLAPPAALDHDPAAGADVTPLWGQEPERVPVPVPGDAERPMQDARRRQHRTSQRRGD
jgi:hypothetical protein